MNLPELRNLDLSIARARIALSLIAMLSLYIDPSTAGGLFHLNAYALTTLLCHLAYSVGMYFALSRRFSDVNLQLLSTCFDLFFATAVAFITEGQTSASYVFFVFAIVASGSRVRSRPIVTVTFCSVVLYLSVIVLTQGITSVYDMRAVYLAIAGYLIGFFSQQRALFEAQVRELETRAERQSIARSLHDGYVQALAGVNLRLETCRALLNRNRPQDALLEITDLQTGVAREYDAVRIYLRSLAGIEQGPARSSPRRLPIPALKFAPRSVVAVCSASIYCRSCSRVCATPGAMDWLTLSGSMCTRPTTRFRSRSKTMGWACQTRRRGHGHRLASRGTGSR